MTRAEFILERLPLYPVSAVARMAGCSVEKVNAVRDLAVVVDMRPDRAPVAVELPPPAPPAPPERPEWRPSLPPMARRVVLDVAKKHGVSLVEMVTRSVRRGPNDLSAIRHEAWSLLRAIPDADGEPLYSLPRIGAWFGGKDHTTVLYGIRRHEAIQAGLTPARKPYNPVLAAMYRQRMRDLKRAARAEVQARIAWRESGLET